jgi:hypothetical protein
MLNRLRPRLTYANVVATLCLFLLLGGGAVAAVTSFVQANGTIRGCVSKAGQLTVLRKGKTKCTKGMTAISWSRGGASGPAGGDLTGNYPSPTIKPDAVTGATLDESSLAQVPSAASADNASQLGGLAPGAFFPSSNVAQINRSLTQHDPGTNGKAVLDLGGMQLTMDCTYDQGTDKQSIDFFASTGASNANGRVTWAYVHSGAPPAADEGERGLTAASDTQLFTRPIGNVPDETGAGTFVYRDDAQSITIPFRYSVSYADATCEVAGTATRAN